MEGPTDELIVQRAYKDVHGKLPIENGVDVISVDSLAFKRYCDLAILVKKPLRIITDNDGDVQRNISDKYIEFTEKNGDLIEIHYEVNELFHTIEPSVLAVNSLEAEVFNKFRRVISKKNSMVNKNVEEVESFMINNKAEWGLRVFDSEECIEYPAYIKMQYDNTLVLACAGSGKTYGMCNDSRSLSEESTKKVLMLSYTHKGIHSIKKEYAKQNNGVLDKNVVISTWFQFILKELIRPYQRSFLEKFSQIRSIDFSNMYGVDYAKRNSKSYFLNRNNDVKANRASEFALLLNILSDGAVLKRLEDTYACIYIDELQDLVGKDIELIELLFLSSIKIYCVGDYKQSTLKTHNPRTDRKKVVCMFSVI